MIHKRFVKIYTYSWFFSYVFIFHINPTIYSIGFARGSQSTPTWHRHEKVRGGERKREGEGHLRSSHRLNLPSTCSYIPLVWSYKIPIDAHNLTFFNLIFSILFKGKSLKWRMRIDRQQWGKNILADVTVNLRWVLMEHINGVKLCILYKH